jgi:hypothetical protein
MIDEEIAFCGALLHGLGLVPADVGENRFEVDGADAARRVLSEASSGTRARWPSMGGDRPAYIGRHSFANGG